MAALRATDGSPLALTLTAKAPHPLQRVEGAREVGVFAGDIRILTSDGAFVARGHDLHVEVSPDRGEATVAYSSRLGDTAQERTRLFYAIAFALTVLLRGRGLVGLHAAALTRGGRGLLLAADSDSGKSTSALALLRRGWGHVTDDALLLNEDQDGVVAFTFRRDLCIDPDAAEHFPELGGRTWPSSLSDPAKWRVDIEALYPGLHVPSCRPTVVLFPTVRAARRSRLVPVSSMAAFRRLMVHTAPMDMPDPTGLRHHVHVLGRLVAQTDAYELEAGADVFDDPAAFDAVLTGALGASSSSPSRGVGRII